ncbi:MAG TPA: hypothetical protein DCE56_14460 [Cyanobacteria bacterium UBA8553]|nr:hypothetical protein [Cyanobacteria bacterium UBA8553]HAJ60252.1 hypothetical protein [Cyanobacteria bacterium UBA8543]
MPEPTKIKITQRKGQPLEVEVLNVTGDSCTELTVPLNQLGASQTQLKEEYFEPSVSVDTTTEIHL